MIGKPSYTSQYSKSWALVVGINAYTHARKLDYACNDAQVFADLIVSKYNFPKENVTVLLDAAATASAIRKGLHALARTAQNDDRVVVFYAGHGTTITDAFEREVGFLVPVDGDSSETSTLIPWKDLNDTSLLIHAKHMLFVMDACYGGLLGTRHLSPGSRRLASDMMTRFTRQFLTAGKADQVVADSGGPRPGHSVFTGHLLDALEGGLAATDGVIGANALMAYVYDRVSKDDRSLQSPHYGFLHGDGDFYFAAPGVGDPSIATGQLTVVPPDLAPQRDEPQVQSIVEQTKEYLSDRKYRIALNDLIMRELRATQQKLGESAFPIGSNATASLLAERVAQYEDACDQLMRVAVLIGRWGEPEHYGLTRQIVRAVSEQIVSKGGLTIWLELRYYPLHLLLFSAGVGAVVGDNYRGLRDLFLAPAWEQRQNRMSTAVQVSVIGTRAIGSTDAMKHLPGLGTKRLPQADNLFARVQPRVEDLLFVGQAYERAFERFELLMALTYLDVGEDEWTYLGRYALKNSPRWGGYSPFADLCAEAERDKDEWPPLKAGMFKGSIEHFRSVADKLRLQLKDISLY